MSSSARRRISAGLPDFPWDSLAQAKATANTHDDGIVDLSVGTPVDPVDEVIRDALTQASAVPGYPTTIGTTALRDAAADALIRRYGVIDSLDRDAILPVIGTKEAIASVMSMLGIGVGDLVVIPEIAYPTYEVGALLAGADVIRSDAPHELSGRHVAAVFLNSPSNPTGAVHSVEHLRAIVEWARSHDTIVISDECYLGLTWDVNAVSILDERVCAGDTAGLLAVHSLSKVSNLASYRAGFFAGDQELIAELLAVRKHAGLIVPFAVQAAMTAALVDDVHVDAQRERYRNRRVVLSTAARQAGFQIHHSQAGLYLWVTRGEDCRQTVDWFAAHGILVAPGDFYGPLGRSHVRMALTATDERIAAAASRLSVV